MLDELTARSWAEVQNAQYEMEILRYRQMEDAVVENIMQAQPADQGQTASSKAENPETLSPIEILFRQER